MAERMRRAAYAGVPATALATYRGRDFFKTAKQKGYVNQYVRMLSRRAGPASGTLACDISQKPSQRPRCSPWLPSPTRTSNWCLLDARLGEQDPGYFFTPKELGSMMGWPLLKTDGSDKYAACMHFELSALSPQEQRGFQDNSMHLMSVGCFMTWVLAHCLRRDTVK